ncbi:Serine phosphatase RsbU, regulator of sigma subunit [Acidisarcina polymorpha]|uniref:Serine phosphatase RsbU, regulator of sigma subunit n=1 Tax=Acidisarcina polymorpha TaxID=2211140 RepID=A0A2Z5G3A5_9BACT|nr:SpoIIE family protein phosphatase [Acidisarcina polymorpha]AXC13601.1 Serine phosphatase RsbU, regulator of sigma subunit [Acidisarcina polymorpha]
MRSSRYSTLLRILLAMIALAGIVFWFSDTRDRFELGMHPEQHARMPFEVNADNRRVASLQQEAEHSGLVKGSTIDSLNGVPYAGIMQFIEIVYPASPGESLTVDFRRPDGSSGSAVITLAARQTLLGVPPGFASVFWRSFILFDLLPLFSMLIGYWVVFVKPDEPNAWLLLVLLLYPAVVFAWGTGFATGEWLLFRGLYYELLQNFGVLALVPFAVYFPERSRIDVRRPWLKWVILAPAVVCGLLEIKQAIGQYFYGGNSPAFAKLMTQVDRFDNALALVCVGFYIALMSDKLLSASTEDARRRLRILLAGTGTGVGALIVVFVLLPDLGFSPNTPAHLWAAYLGAVLFLLAPVALAYVVLVQRAMDVSILVRQGTKYALAKATLLVVQFTLAAVVTYRFLLPLLTQKQIPRDQLWQAVVFIVLILLLRLGFSRQSKNWLDKKFFREAYDSEQVLNELSEEVRKYTESGPLLKTVAKCVAETLHVTQIGMLLRDGATFCVTQAVGHFPGNAGTLALAVNSSTIRNLSNTNAPAELYREDPDAWYLMADEVERQTLDDLGAELLLPLPGRDRLMGVMALGPKQSEAAYSKSDLHLLQVLATQTGMALEVSELAHSLAKEAAQRERSNREMEIAREVQERLFPQEMPMLLGGDVAGHCRPALGVGGDYYDVFPLQDGRLGLAIGDVSGKGISAALLMASLRASLRGVTLDNPRDFAKLMDKVNRLVYEASASNRYATFFFGALDPVTQVLECVNAGHNAPLILRREPDGSSEILRLEADGPVVGLLPFAPYSEQSVQLRAGDLLVTYTDGISEAMTKDDEEWGEERMMAAAASANGASASEVLKIIFAEADKFTAGAPQHDDMTLLILKLNSL